VQFVEMKITLFRFQNNQNSSTIFKQKIILKI